jgi:hypothetical protein
VLYAFLAERSDEMLKVKIEFRSIGCEKVVRFLNRFKKSFPLGYKIWLQDNGVFACFILESIEELNSFVRRLKRMNTVFKFHQIMRVQIRRMRD